MNEGYIKLYRCILDSELLRKGSSCAFMVYLYLYLKANHSPSRLEGCIIGRGQHLSSKPEIEAGLHYKFTYKQIRLACAWLEANRFIKVESKPPRKLLFTLRHYQQEQGQAESENRAAVGAGEEIAQICILKGLDGADTLEKGRGGGRQTSPSGQAINKNNIINKNIDIEGCNKRSEEMETRYSEEEHKRFEKFQAWLRASAPDVANMNQPFTIEQFLTLKRKHTDLEIVDILEQMENWEGLQKRQSAFKTFNTFMRRKKERPLKVYY